MELQRAFVAYSCLEETADGSHVPARTLYEATTLREDARKKEHNAFIYHVYEGEELPTFVADNCLVLAQIGEDGRCSQCFGPEDCSVTDVKLLVNEDVRELHIALDEKPPEYSNSKEGSTDDVKATSVESTHHVGVRRVASAQLSTGSMVELSDATGSPALSHNDETIVKKEQQVDVGESSTDKPPVPEMTESPPAKDKKAAPALRVPGRAADEPVFHSSLFHRRGSYRMGGDARVMQSHQVRSAKLEDSFPEIARGESYGGEYFDVRERSGPGTSSAMDMQDILFSKGRPLKGLPKRTPSVDRPSQKSEDVTESGQPFVPSAPPPSSIFGEPQPTEESKTFDKVQEKDVRPRERTLSITTEKKDERAVREEGAGDWIVDPDLGLPYTPGQSTSGEVSRETHLLDEELRVSREESSATMSGSVSQPSQSSTGGATKRPTPTELLLRNFNDEVRLVHADRQRRKMVETGAVETPLKLLPGRGEGTQDVGLTKRDEREKRIHDLLHPPQSSSRRELSPPSGVHITRSSGGLDEGVTPSNRREAFVATPFRDDTVLLRNRSGSQRPSPKRAVPLASSPRVLAFMQEEGNAHALCRPRT